MDRKVTAQDSAGAIIAVMVIWLLLGLIVWGSNLAFAYAFGWPALSFGKSMVATAGGAGLWLLYRIVKDS